ncbi:MAG: outer membrane beta-barrel protein [Alphaproteobacteria bacterium]|nr:outer membrane beta-barrel protein [Alphaproteobacteria bacterium]
MLRFRLAAAAAAAFVLPALAQAMPLSSPYVEVSGGWAGAGRIKAQGVDAVLGPLAVTEHLKTGWIASALAGARLGQSPFAVEAEALYARNNISSPDLDAAFGAPLQMQSRAKGVLANFKVSAPNGWHASGFTLRPYAAGGVGYGRNDIDILGDDYGGDGTVWQAKAGLELASAGRFAWDLGYRYLSLPRFHTDQLGLDVHMKTHLQAVTFGLVYRLGGR